MHRATNALVVVSKASPPRSAGVLKGLGAKDGPAVIF